MSIVWFLVACFVIAIIVGTAVALSRKPEELEEEAPDAGQ